MSKPKPMPVCPTCGSSLTMLTYQGSGALSVECMGWNCEFRLPLDREWIIRAAMKCYEARDKA